MPELLGNPPVKLYDYLFSGNGYKVRLALAQLDIPVQYEFLDLLTGETRSTDFLDKNPMGQIPVLELEDGTLLRESNAIVLWLTENTALSPTDSLLRNQVLQWMFFEQSNIDKVIGRSRFLHTYPDFVKVLPKGYIEMLLYLGNEALSVLEKELTGKRYLVGEQYSAADIVVYAYVHKAEEGGFELSGYHSITHWIETVSGQPGHIPIDYQPPGNLE